MSAVRRRARHARTRLRLYREFVADARRYERSALANGSRNVEAAVTKDYHRVEKGLALREPRRPFGADLNRRLNAALPGLAGSEEPFVQHATSALRGLGSWNDAGLVDDDLAPLRCSSPSWDDVESFIGTRHSVRHFAERPVPLDLLRRAVTLAVNTPSVCNRQAWHVRLYSGARVAQVLQHQNGNAGFRDNVPALAIVTVDARLFTGYVERNQGWIEGGLFAMTFDLALHGIGLDSCMLNMSRTNEQNRALREAEGIQDHELIIMMIAIGYGAEGHRHARSPRRGLGEVLVSSSGFGPGDDGETSG